ncbi:conserved membrane hypothetical protein [Paraburkholderia tropica]
MKRFIVAALAAFSTFAFGVTTTPVSLLNPTGSTAGQAIISTGPSTAPAWGAVPLTGITGTLALTNGGTGATTAAAARTNLGLGTAATASTGTSGATVPLLNAANTWSAAQTFSALITPSTTIGIKGTAAADSAQAGSIGEVLTGQTSTTSMTSATTANCASVSLTAGDWDVSGNIRYNPAGTTTIALLAAGIGTTSATLPGLGAQTQLVATFTTGQPQYLPTPVVRVNAAATTTVYLVGSAGFGTNTMSCDGLIRARRIR